MMGIIHYQPQLVGSQDLWKSTVLSGDWYIYICLTFSPIQLEAFGGIFFNDKCLRRMVWSPRFSPPHGEKKRFSDIKKVQSARCEWWTNVPWRDWLARNFRHKGSLPGHMMVSSETVSLYVFFLDKSQGASDLNFNPTSTKPLWWTRNMFFWTHDLEKKNPEKIWSCLFQDKHGSMDLKKKIGKNPSFLPPIALR